MSHYIDHGELRSEIRYQDACARAATRQGLDPIMARLEAEGISYRLEQTGGFVMVVMTADSLWGLTNDGGEDDDIMLCAYPDPGTVGPDDEVNPYLTFIGLTLDVAVALIHGGVVYPIEDGHTLIDGKPLRFVS